MPSSSSNAIISRSTYIAQLRRAFILRCHPDRFRQHHQTHPSIQRDQSALLSALSNRMNDRDFHDYASNIFNSTTTAGGQQRRHIGDVQQPMKYYLEARNGSLLRLSLDLHDSVFEILQSMSDALKSTGAVSMPPPPPPTPQSSEHNTAAGSDAHHKWHWAQQSSSNSTSSSTSTGGIDDRYNINTNKGRDLHSFLKSITPSQIEERRAARMDVSTAALINRRLYGFQSIDGIRLGWSSESFAVLLHSLIKLHEEYNSRFHVTSFYPLRLVFSPDDDAFYFFHKQQQQNTRNINVIRSLDVYGGNLYLNPACTQLEWLESLQEVTHDNLALFEQNREAMKRRVDFLQHEMGIKIKKGHSCSSWEYHMFLERIMKPLMGSSSSSSSSIQANDDNDGVTKRINGTGIHVDDDTKHNRQVDPMAEYDNATSNLSPTAVSNSNNNDSTDTLSHSTSKSPSSSSSLTSSSTLSPFGTPGYVRLVVESPMACRRAKVTTDGNIRIASYISSIGDLMNIITKLAQSANDKWNIEQTKRQHCNEAINQIKWEIGVQRVYRVGTMVNNNNHDDFLACIERMVRQSHELREPLSGQSIGIAGAGLHCHLADDGSVVIPHNFY